MSRESDVRALSNSALLSRLDVLAGRERARAVLVLRHLGEVERRRLYLQQGFASLFAYCVTRLRYSESEAGRRVAAARAARRFPEIANMLERGDVSLASVAMVSRILTPANARDVLARIRGRSKRDVEALVSGFRPERVLRDQVRKVCVRVADVSRDGAGASAAVPDRTNPGAPAAASTTATGSHGAAAEPRAGATEPAAATLALQTTSARACSVPDTPDDSRGAASTPPGGSAPEAPPASMPTRVVEKHVLKFAAGDAFMAKLEETRAILSARMPGATLEQVFEAALDCFLDAESPRRRDARRRERARRRKSAAGASGENAGGGNQSGRKKPSLKSLPPGGVSTPGDTVSARGGADKARNEPSAAKPGAAGARNARKGSRAARNGAGSEPNARAHIPTRTRDRVYARDGGRCTYVSPSGRRCGSTHFLQVDHVTPVARGGGCAPGNLRLLCGKHNRMEAERVLGARTVGPHRRE